MERRRPDVMGEGGCFLIFPSSSFKSTPDPLRDSATLAVKTPIPIPAPVPSLENSYCKIWVQLSFS